jgi:hypothetical protein
MLKDNLEQAEKIKNIRNLQIMRATEKSAKESAEKKTQQQTAEKLKDEKSGAKSGVKIENKESKASAKVSLTRQSSSGEMNGLTAKLKHNLALKRKSSTT